MGQARQRRAGLGPRASRRASGGAARPTLARARTKLGRARGHVRGGAVQHRRRKLLHGPAMYTGALALEMRDATAGRAGSCVITHYAKVLVQRLLQRPPHRRPHSVVDCAWLSTRRCSAREQRARRANECHSKARQSCRTNSVLTPCSSPEGAPCHAYICVFPLSADSGAVTHFLGVLERFDGGGGEAGAPPPPPRAAPRSLRAARPPQRGRAAKSATAAARAGIARRVLPLRARARVRRAADHERRRRGRGV
jgi:hypothetical protein